MIALLCFFLTLFASPFKSKAKFDAVAGSFSFASDGEWAKSRQVWTQFQNVQPNNQFRDGKVQPIIWPADAKTGNLICPYAEAKKK
jgi:branched-chain amino acid transport system substrate-binding protein